MNRVSKKGIHYKAMYSSMGAQQIRMRDLERLLTVSHETTGHECQVSGKKYYLKNR